MKRLRLGLRARAGLATAAAALVAAGWSLPAQAATGPVSSTPAAGTPQLATTGSTEQVRQLASVVERCTRSGPSLRSSAFRRLRPEQRVRLLGGLAVRHVVLESERQRDRQLHCVQP